jgi:hypothetical protein
LSVKVRNDVRSLERRRLEEVAQLVAKKSHSPLVKKQLTFAFLLIAGVTLIPLSIWAYLERKPAFVTIWAGSFALSLAIAVPIYFLLGRSWKRVTAGAIASALARDPLLTFFDPNHGLVFIDADGYFVERPDLAFQAWRDPFFSISSRTYDEGKHAIVIHGILGSYDKTVRFELPSAIDAQTVRSALDATHRSF